MAAFAGVKTEELAAPDRRAVDPAQVEEHLAADTDRAIKAVLVAHVDTGTSVRNDIEAIRAAIDAADHPALLMVDGIASLGCERYEMDAWGVDVTVGASQKGLMVPPGLGFVWAGPRAWEAHATAGSAHVVLGLDRRGPQDEPHYLRYCGTPPIPHLFGLREALVMIEEEGLEAAWRRHAVLADAVRAAVEAWGAPDGLELNIIDPAARANSVTMILGGAIDADRLRAVCFDQAGLTLGVGLGDHDGRGVPHRAHGPPQPADDPRDARHDRGRAGRHRRTDRLVRRGRRGRRHRRRHGTGARLTD